MLRQQSDRKWKEIKPAIRGILVANPLPVYIRMKSQSVKQIIQLFEELPHMLQYESLYKCGKSFLY